MVQDQFYKALSRQILSCKRDNQPLVVGINGVDGSGKTEFTKRLSSQMGQAIRIHIDDFHHPKIKRYQRGECSPLGFYHDSINFAQVRDRVLRPIKKAKNFPINILTKSFDLATDQARFETAEIDRCHVILVEGIFLFRPELAPFLDIKILIECDFEITLERMKRRDIENAEDIGAITEFERRFRNKYMAGQKLYMQDISPRSLADIIIDNCNYNSPQVTYCKL